MENKLWWRLLGGLAVVAMAAVVVEGEPWEDGAVVEGTVGDGAVGDGAVGVGTVADGSQPEQPLYLYRTERAAKDKEPCRYSRGSWSECDLKTNMRTRKLTLKKGDPSLCQNSKTIQKKCKKSCRYEKTQWSECNAATGEMFRTDKLKANSDQACEKTRRVAKKCNKNKQAKTTKDKGRRNRQ